MSLLPDRRDFLQTSISAAITASPAIQGLSALAAPPEDPRLTATRASALSTLTGNIRVLPQRPAGAEPGYAQPVLIEGSTYAGVWQECGPHEALVWAQIAPHLPATDSAPSPIQVARNNHMAFFELQRADGQLPASVKTTETGYGQIQMVVPIAATAWELSRVPGLPDAQQFLEAAYAACSRWDAWLRRYRDTRRTGLVEGFCTYDTGHDNSPRWAGIPNRCPDADARKCPPIPSMPRLCPDLSATVFGGRIALAAMARALGKRDDESRWLADAETLRMLILTRLYSPEDAAFYDLDAQNTGSSASARTSSPAFWGNMSSISRSAATGPSSKPFGTASCTTPRPSGHPGLCPALRRTTQPSSGPFRETPGAAPRRPSPPCVPRAGCPTTANRPSFAT